MGEAAIVNYIASGHKKTVRVESEKELQNELQKLIRDGASIESVKKDRNLEQAFIKLGLHGDGT
jgi:hypothetical protein